MALVVALLLLLTASSGGALSYFQAKPQGSLGVSRPVISQQFQLENGEAITRATMWLDGTRVEPTWDSTGLVSYTPPAALAPGAHTVRLSVEVGTGVDGWFYDPVVSTFTFTVASGARATFAAPGQEELRALQRVNQLRKAAGLAPMAYDSSLGAGALGHAQYLLTNPSQVNVDAHRQVSGAQGYFGTAPGQRVMFYGYTGGGVAEVINFTDKAEEAVDGWMDTLYHRLPLIYPGNTAMGYGLAAAGAERVNVLEAGPNFAAGVAVAWPYDGQVGVPTGWDGAESPDPLRLYAGARGPVGYTITLTFGGEVRSLTLDRYSLSGPQGPVAVMPFDPVRDDILTDTVALIPYDPLAPGSRYTVTLSGQVDEGDGPQPYSRSWSFTTSSESVPLVERRAILSRGGVLNTVTVDGSGFGSGFAVYIGGLPVRDLSVKSAGQLTFSPPVGLPQTDLDLLVVTPEGREVTWRQFVEGDEVQFPGGTPFRTFPVTVHGVRLAAPGLQHQATGAILLPEQALSELGALREDVSAIDRTYWSWGGRTGDYTFGRVVSTMGEQRFLLAMPVQERGGTTYVDREFVSRLAQEPVTMADGAVQVGLSDLGGHWARPQIIRLLREGIVSGVGAGQYQPNAPLTRAAFVKMLAGARQWPVRPGQSGGFADTAAHWLGAQGYIAAAVEAGVVVPGEYAGGRFRPDQPITREEIAVLVTRALGLDAEARSRVMALADGGATVAGKTFTDAGSWTRAGHVAVAMEQGIITGYQGADGLYTFAPGRQATRAEAAVMVLRAMDR
jgi:uncharacterized protein YkwD